MCNLDRICLGRREVRKGVSIFSWSKMNMQIKLYRSSYLVTV